MKTEQIFVCLFILLYLADTVTAKILPNIFRKTSMQGSSSSSSSSPTDHVVDLQICKKVPPQRTEVAAEAGQVNVGASDFAALIQKSNFYVDKTELIREIIHAETKVIVITAAKGHGKTTNLNMLHSFLEIPVAVNSSIMELKSTFAYNFFANGKVISSSDDLVNVRVDPPPMISQFPDDISKHLGKYTIIHLDFADIEPGINGVRFKIAEIFKRHTYLRRSKYEKDYDDQLDKITQRQPSHNELIKSIPLLCELLFKFHGMYVMILIDEYDRFINQIVLPTYGENNIDRHQNKLLKFYDDFLINSVSEKNSYLTRAVLTGTVGVAKLTNLIPNWSGGLFVNINELLETEDRELDPTRNKAYQKLLRKILDTQWSIPSSQYQVQVRVCEKVLTPKIIIPHGGKDEIISIGASTFEQFVRESNFYADKSELILESIGSGYSLIVITAAQRWGKTINLDMIRTFLEIPVAKNGSILDIKSTFAYNYFANGVIIPASDDDVEVRVDPPPMISQFPVFISKHLGKHPVIHIDFADIEPSIDCVKFKITEIFKRHAYLADYIDQQRASLGYSYAEHVLEHFHKTTKGEISESELVSSICFLSELLEKFHKEGVMILIAEYDSFINQLISRQYVEEMSDLNALMDFYRHFFIASVKTNVYRTRVVITGIIGVAGLFVDSDCEHGRVFVDIMDSVAALKC